MGQPRHTGPPLWLWYIIAVLGLAVATIAVMAAILVTAEPNPACSILPR